MNGGYRLAVDPNNITVAELIQALEGPIAITECNLGSHHCLNEVNCAIRAPWQQINRVITQALMSVRLSDLVNSRPSRSTGDLHGIQVRH